MAPIDIYSKFILCEKNKSFTQEIKRKSLQIDIFLSMDHCCPLLLRRNLVRMHSWWKYTETKSHTILEFFILSFHYFILFFRMTWRHFVCWPWLLWKMWVNYFSFYFFNVIVMIVIALKNQKRRFKWTWWKILLS